MSSILYGPVPSWRLGRSLGVDLLPADGKTCSFNCTYCQLGRTVRRPTVRAEFIASSVLARELEAARNVAADYVTFSGMGEPTLASNLGEALRLAREVLGLPTAVLTNSSLMVREDVRRDLARADVVVAKLDAPDEVQINTPLRPCPVTPLTAEEIGAIREEFHRFPNVVTVYDTRRPEVTPLDIEETRRRRPELQANIGRN
jgi:wyosine [tRNA(Phe)-imidazoG37] synthetase (radical SAM superfamily)